MPSLNPQPIIQTLLLQINYNKMSANELLSRKSRYSDKYENSSVYNHSVKSELNNLSIDLPRQRNKYNKIEKEIIEKQTKRQCATVNLTNTKYPVIQEVCGADELNWKIQTFAESKSWNIKWCDTGVTNEILQKMHYTQKINHFPSMSIISRKNTLAITLNKMKEQFPNEYSFFPRTFLYPNDYPKIRHYHVQSRKRGLVKTFIVKPEAGCQGRGIYLSQNPADFQQQERCVVQKYLSNPLLYRGLKFDLRVYVLLACCNPLRVYVYNEGLVRFATQTYELPKAQNLNNYYMHLTNYAINKENPNYEYNHSVNDMSHGHKKSLAEFFKTLKEMGFRANSYWSQIKDNIIKCLIAAQPHLISNYKSCRPSQPVSNMCFQVLGFDFMIDNQDRCYLLQVNHTPSFSTDTPLDHIIKKNLIKDTLQMMIPSQEEANLRQQLEMLRQRQKYAKFKSGAGSEMEKENIAKLINQAREKQELLFKGTYELIYPSTNQAKIAKYNQFSTYSSKVFYSHNTISTSTLQKNDIRNRLKDAQKTKTVSKQSLKQNISKNVDQSLQPQKKNIIYNYNYLKKDIPSKKALLTLPSEPYRAETHPTKQKFHSGKSSKVLSKQKIKTQKSLSRDVVLPKQFYRPTRNPIQSEQKRGQNEFVLSKRQRSGYTSQDKQQSTRQLNSFTNRIRSYKTPLMF